MLPEQREPTRLERLAEKRYGPALIIVGGLTLCVMFPFAYTLLLRIFH